MTQWQVGDKCKCKGEGSTIFTVAQLNERGVHLLLPDGRLHGREDYSKLIPIELTPCTKNQLSEN